MEYIFVSITSFQFGTLVIDICFPYILFPTFKVHVVNCIPLQEKEFIEKHSIWLNDELNDKINILSEHRKMHIDFEEDMTNKLADVS